MTINIKTIIALLAIVIGGAVTLSLINWETIEGHQIGVMETWTEGVISEPFYPKTYILWPAFMKKLIPYDVNQQVFVMNDNKEDFAEGRDADAYLVQSADQQDMWISLTLQWRRDPLKVVELHKTVRDAVEERLIRPETMRIVKDAATKRLALEAYAGVGLVELQTEIEDKLRDESGELRQRGIIVDTFVVERIRLDDKYTEEIKDKQVAIQERLKNIEQEKAAIAAAAKAKAEAQADYEKQIVEATRDKEKGILEAEKEKAQIVLAAEAAKEQVELAAAAEKARNVLEAEGQKEADLLRAVGILAVGEAEAEATKLRMAAYATTGAEAFVTMQVAESMKGAYSNIQGYVPENMNISVLSEKFVQGVQLVVDPLANNSNP